MSPPTWSLESFLAATLPEVLESLGSSRINSNRHPLIVPGLHACNYAIGVTWTACLQCVTECPSCTRHSESPGEGTHEQTGPRSWSNSGRSEFHLEKT